MVVERITKLLVLMSLAAALVLTAVVGSSMRSELPSLFATTFVAGFLLGAILPDGIVAVLACAYLVPAVVLACVGTYPAEYHTLWVVALFGAVLPQSARRPWMLPSPWRVPFVGWAVAIAVTWPLIVAREVDFNAAQLTSFSLSTSAFGIRTPTTVLLVLETAITLLVSFVWLDWLFSTFSDEAERTFDRRILVPLIGSCAVACVVAGYQVFGDIRWLNPDFSGFRRAAGTLVDANAFGMLAAVWGGAMVAWAAAPGTARTAVATVGAVLMCAGAWVSGSRTSLVATMIVFAVALYSWFRAARGLESSHGSRVVAAGLAVVVVSGLLILSLTGLPTVLGATRRLWWIVPGASGLSMQEFTKLMWDRDGYGAAAVRMFRQTPIFGVGVGSFPILVSDFGVSRFGGPLLPDNAQNWIRHQLVELGALGSVGWVIWAWVFGRFVLGARARPGRAFQASIIGGILLAIVAVSQVGMPTQNLAVAITFWTLVFWYAVLVRAPTRVNQMLAANETPAVDWRHWAIMAALVIVYVGGTLHLATSTLRVPMRAREFGWKYDYGFYPPEPSERGGEYRWAQKHAVAVVPAPAPVVRLTVSVNRHDIAANPVHARVWHDDRLVIDTVLRDLRPVTTYLRITSDPQWLMLTTDVDRVIVPAQFGVPDNRELGLAVEWTFLDELPPAAEDALRK